MGKSMGGNPEVDLLRPASSRVRDLENGPSRSSVRMTRGLADS